MSNLGSYKASEEKLGDGFKPLPVGTYMAMIIESELKDNKDGTGNYIWAKWKIVDGEYKDRFLFSNTTFTHSVSQMAEQIGRKTLNTIMASIGVSEIQDTSQLHNAAMLIDVVVKNDDQYGAQNEIKNYHSATDDPSGAAQSAPAQQPQQSSNPAQGESKPSWAS